MNIASRRLITSALAAVTLCASAALPSAGVERGPQRRVNATALATDEARVIVKLRADSPLARAQSANGAVARPLHAQALGARLGMALTDGRALGARTQVLKGRGLTSRELADRLAAQPDVEYASVDERKFALAAPNDPLYGAGQTANGVPSSGQWYLRPPLPNSAFIPSNLSVISAINAESAWDVTQGSSSVVVAVIDTGVRKDHPDLTSKLLNGYDFIASTSVSNDGDGRDADASDPGDFGCGEATSSWHGTQTSGLIGAATNNGIGMAGVGRNVMLLPVRALGCGGGFDSDIQAAMLWSVGISVPGGVPPNANPAKVVNMSLGSAGSCSAAYANTVAQVLATGAVVVVAAGNDGLDVGTPANCAGVIAVAGLRNTGSKVGYSDLGPSIAIAAPAGNCVNDASGPCLFPLLTTSNSGSTTPVSGAAGATYTGTGSDASLGTSFSAPLVSGVAALIYSANPTMKPAQVLAALQLTARAFPSSGFNTAINTCTAPTATPQMTECYCTTSTCGAGMLDAGAATLAASRIHAAVSAASTSVTSGAAVQLDGSGSWPSGGATISQYNWSVTSGPGTLTGSTTATPVLQTTGAGTVVVSLAVLDSASQQATASASIVVASPAAPASSGGGGAMEFGWLLGWFASMLGVWFVTPRRARSTTEI